MNNKIISHGDDARAKIKEGIDLCADTVKDTLGPKGRNVIVMNEFVRSMNDGYWIMDSIQVEDEVVNAGCKMMKKTCQETNDKAGDGTTSTAIMVQSIIDEALGKEANPVDTKRELEQDLVILKEELKKLSKPVKTSEDIKNIATIAGNNDEAIGSAIGGITEALGNKCAILSEKTQDKELKVEISDGIYFNQGYGEARGFISNYNRKTADLENAMILCLDGNANLVEQLDPFINKVLQARGKAGVAGDLNLLIVCKDFDLVGQAGAYLAINNQNRLENRMQKLENGQMQKVGFRVCVVEAPRNYGNQVDILEDIAIATGGRLVGERNGEALKDMDITCLGGADRVIVEEKATTIGGAKGTKKAIKARVSELEHQAKSKKTYEKESLDNRAKIISSGVGVIKVGGITAFETNERYLRVEDAIFATRGAVEEGSCVGGGFTYYLLAKKVKTDIMKVALKSIVKQIAINTGKNPKDILDEMDKTGNGYNARTNKFCNLEKDGVLDSTRVIRTVLENSISFASLFITTESTVIAENPKKDEK